MKYFTDRTLPRAILNLIVVRISEFAVTLYVGLPVDAAATAMWMAASVSRRLSGRKGLETKT